MGSGENSVYLVKLACVIGVRGGLESSQVRFVYWFFEWMMDVVVMTRTTLHDGWLYKSGCQPPMFDCIIVTSWGCRAEVHVIPRYCLLTPHTIDVIKCRPLYVGFFRHIFDTHRLSPLDDLSHLYSCSVHSLQPQFYHDPDHLFRRISWSNRKGRPHKPAESTPPS
jgi:hypothetical protein